MNRSFSSVYAFPSGMMWMIRRFLAYYPVMAVPFAAWALGGRVSWAEWTLMGMGFLFVTFCAALRFAETLKSCAAPHPNRRAVPHHLPERIVPVLFALWILYEALRLLNPMYHVIGNFGGQWFLLKAEPIVWLPSVVHPALAAKRMLLITSLILSSAAWLSLRCERRQIVSLLWVLLANATLLAMVGTVIHLLDIRFLLGWVSPVNPRFFASFFYANHYCAWQILHLGFAWSLEYYHQRRIAHGRKHRDLVWLARVCALIIALSIPLSASRSGTLLLMILSVLWVATQTKSTRRVVGGGANYLRWMKLAGLLGAISLVSAAGMWLSWERMEKRVDDSLKEWRELSEEPLSSMRFLFVRDTTRMFRARPLTGWGLDSYQFIIPRFAGPEWATRAGAPRTGTDAAHSDWVQYLAELGLLSFFLLTSGLVLFAIPVIRTGLRGGTLPILAAIGLIGFMAVFEFPLRNPSVLVTLAMAAAMVKRWIALRSPQVGMQCSSRKK